MNRERSPTILFRENSLLDEGSDAGTSHHERRSTRELYAECLGYKGDRPAGPRVCLEHVQDPSSHRELDVNQAFDTDALGELFHGFTHLVHDVTPEGDRGQGAR